MRPLSPKGYSELIFKDAAASIRRTAQEFQYQLIVQRAYEEGEEELLADEEDEDGTDGALRAEKDEKTFLLDESLHFRSETRPGGEKVFAWKDLSGDLGDHYEFVCDRSVAPATQSTFELAAIQCQYERKYRQSHQKATEEELRQFSFSDPLLPIDDSPSDSTAMSSPAAAAKARASGHSKPHADKTPEKSSRKSKDAAPKQAPTPAPAPVPHPQALEILAKEKAELHLFDFNSSTFILQDAEVIALVSEVGPWQYWLQITGKEKDWLGQPVIADINPVFNFEYLSFIFNHYTQDGSAYSWLLRFKDQETEERFQEGLMRALWEQLNETKWTKAKDNDRDYVLEAFQDLTMEEIPEGDEEGEEEQQEEEDEGDETAEEEEDDEDDGARSEHYDTDESEDDVETRPDDGNVNSQLAVGYKHDRSFVVRGSKIGVFKHTPNNNLEFSTNISKVQTPDGKLFSPKKVMLHAEDSNMILQNEQDPHSLYRMDLEYGKVVDKWKVDDDIPVNIFTPEKVTVQRDSIEVAAAMTLLTFLFYRNSLR